MPKVQDIVDKEKIFDILEKTRRPKYEEVIASFL